MIQTLQRRRTWTAGLIVGLGLVLVFTVRPAVGSAHVSDGNTGLALRVAPAASVSAGATLVVSGRLRSGIVACRAARLVRLHAMRLPNGKFGRIASNRTNRAGEFRFVLRATTTRRMYVSVAGLLRTSYGHSHGCAPSSSRRVIVTVEAT